MAGDLISGKFLPKRFAKDKAGAREQTDKQDKAGEQAEKRRKLEERVLKWLDDITDKVIKVTLADVALRFQDRVDDEELADLKGPYDPIVDEATGLRLSDAVDKFLHEISELSKEISQSRSAPNKKQFLLLYKQMLKAKWEQQKKPIPTAPDGTKYGKYLVNQHGVYAQLEAMDGVDDLYVWRRITRTRIEPVALSRDTTPQRNWRYRYRIIDETGRNTVEIGKEKLARTANSAIAILMSRGVHVVETPEARRHLAKFLRYKPLARVIRAPRTGWFEWKPGAWVFVLPAQTFGRTANGVDVVLDAAPGPHGFHRSGTAQEWRDRIAKPLACNSNVVLAVGTFLAGPLLRWADEPGGGFHFYGHSKLLKTLLLAIGTGVWGKPYVVGAGPDAIGYSWDTTAARLGERAVLRSDIGLGLDEISAGDPKAIFNAAYKLASGVDRGRFGQAERDFIILFLSTGEMSFAEFLPNAQQGQIVRCADIPAAVESGTAFETVTESEVDTVAGEFYPAVKECYGSAGHEWLEYLVPLGPEQIKAELKGIRAAWRALPQVVEIIRRAHPQVVSVVNRFALVAAALHMASAARIVPWSVAEIDAAIIKCMQRWLNQRGNIDTAGELLQEIRWRRQMIAATVNDRFIHLTVKGRRLVPASAADQSKMNAEQNGERRFDGYNKDGKDGEDGRILVRPEAWRRLWAGLDADAVKKHLLEAKLLIPGHDGVVPSPEKISSKKSGRFYVLAPAFVEDVTV